MERLASGAVPLGNVVFETYIGNTRCIICDDFCPVGEGTRQRTEQSKINIGRIWYEAEKTKRIQIESDSPIKL